MSQKSISPKRVVIVGGSLGGLMAALPLLRLGHRVTILERSSTPLLHDQGAGIVAGGETLELWSRFQPGTGEIGDERFKERAFSVTSCERLYLDLQGNIIDREEWHQKMTSWDLLYYLGRAAFDSVDSEYVFKKTGVGVEHGVRNQQDGEYQYGVFVKRLQDAGETVEIIYDDLKNGSEDQTLQADFVIAADGPSSSLRGLLIPEAAQRTYVGYVAFRGTVPETKLSDPAKQVFVERFTFYHGTGCQILAYTIPGPNGRLEPGHRLVNWVWYWNFPQDSEEFKEVMTDRDGKHHRFTLPSGGKMQTQVWNTQKGIARENLPPQFAELVEKTENPFVQAITDLPPPPAGTKVGRLLGGKACLVGDALSGFRPHTAASTSQAALHALLLEQVFGGKMSWDEYEDRVIRHAKFWQDRGVMLGQRSQFGTHPMSQAGGGGGTNAISREQLYMRKKVLEGAPDRR